MKRLEIKDNASSDKTPCENVVSEAASANSSQDQGQDTVEIDEVVVPPSHSSSSMHIPSGDPVLPSSIPSFSQFMRGRKAEDSTVEENIRRPSEKRMRLS